MNAFNGTKLFSMQNNIYINSQSKPNFLYLILQSYS